MKQFTFVKGDTRYDLDLNVIESKFEAYLLFKASTKTGALWLKGFNKNGLITTYLVMHFIYDNAWIDPISEEQEDELIHILSKVKVRIFQQLF